MSDSLPRNFFPVPPKEYDPEYFRELVRSFTLFQQMSTNPSKLTAEGLNLRPDVNSGIQQYNNNSEAIAAGHIPGDLWMLSTGEIRIVIDPDVVVPVSLEYFKQASGKIGELVTFDASAEVGQGITFFMAEGAIGNVSIDAVSDLPATGLAATGEVGSVLLAFELVQPSGASATTAINGVTTVSASSLTLGTNVAITGTAIDFYSVSTGSSLSLTGTNLIGNVGSVTTNV